MAAEAGVSGFTVSQVMAGRKGVAAKTRQRVLAVAARLGYRPDPAAARLVARRHPHRRALNRPVVALLVAKARLDGTLREELKPVEEHLGLDLRMRAVTEATDPVPLARVLWQEGVAGIVLSPGASMTGKRWLAVDWSQFSVVKFSRGVPELAFHVVRHSASEYMLATLNQVIARGYRRLAVLLHHSLNPSDDLARLGVLLAAKARLFPSGTVCEHRECIPEDGHPWLNAELLQWLRHYRPDAFIVPHRVVIYELLAAGLVPPGAMGFAALLSSPKVHPGVPLVSGNDVQEAASYARCLRHVSEMILNGERGWPDHPVEHVITPDWLEGETLPDLAKRKNAVHAKGAKNARLL